MIPWSLRVVKGNGVVILAVVMLLFPHHGVVATASPGFSGENHRVVSSFAIPSLHGSMGLEPDSPVVQEALGDLDERIDRYPQDYEAMLLKALIYFEARRFDEAIAVLNRVVAEVPNFHLAQMIRGDMLLSRVGRVRGIGHNAVLHAMPDSRYVLVEDLREEANARLRAYRTSLQNKGKLPAQLLRLGESVETAILVDKLNHRLYLYGNTGGDASPELLYDFYVSTGRSRGDKRVRGDLRTPEGVYFVTRFTPGSRLPDKYGAAAFPIDYPNALDRYRNKTGSGIWLHGIARQFYSRPPLDSEGCVVLSNRDLEQIIPLITPRFTPFIIADHLEWLEPEEWRTRRDEIMQVLQRWIEDWESGDVQRYLANYAADFWADGHDFDSWSRMRQYQLNHDGSPRLTITDLSLLAYSRNAELAHEVVVADFRMRYSAGERISEGRKRLYLKKEGNRWYVLHESGMKEESPTLAKERSLSVGSL